MNEELVKAIDHRTLAERTATNICSACKHSTDDGPTPGKRCEGCYKVGFMSFEDRDVQPHPRRGARSERYDEARVKE